MPQPVSRRLFLLTALAACTATPRAIGIPPGTRLIVFRHADRDGEDLSATGIARAAAFARALDRERIDMILSPGIRRNLDTARPLAEAKGLEIQRIPQDNPTATLMARGAGRSIVWVGNKGNLAQIWADLGAPGAAPLEYGDLFIVTRGPGGIPRVERRRVDP